MAVALVWWGWRSKHVPFNQVPLGSRVPLHSTPPSPTLLIYRMLSGMLFTRFPSYVSPFWFTHLAHNQNRHDVRVQSSNLWRHILGVPQLMTSQTLSSHNASCCLTTFVLNNGAANNKSTVDSANVVDFTCFLMWILDFTCFDMDFTCFQEQLNTTGWVHSWHFPYYVFKLIWWSICSVPVPPNKGFSFKRMVKCPCAMQHTLSYIDGLLKDCSNSSAIALELRQSCT